MIEKYKAKRCQVGKVDLLVSMILVIFLSVACIDQNIQLCNESIPVGSDITALLVSQHNCTLREKAENEFIVGGRVKSYECGRFMELISERECDVIKIKVSIEPLICGAVTDVLFFASLPLEYIDTDIEFEFKNVEP